MHASITSADLADTRQAATPRAEAFGRNLLLANGLVLGAVALAQSMFDLAGHFLNLGPTAAALYQNPDSIAYLEAHGLALTLAILMLINHKASGPTWNWVAASLHLLLGASNLLFWSSFTTYGLETMGVAATAMHAVFLTLQVITALARSPGVLGGPGAWFRGLTLLTLATGAVLHGASLPMGREAFVAQLFTPTFDAIFAVPMTAAGILGWLLLGRAIFPALWHRLVYIGMLLYFTLSIFIHARTLFTWDTSYVLAFPSWYSLPIFALFAVLTVFVIRQRFQPARRIR